MSFLRLARWLGGMGAAVTALVVMSPRALGDGLLGWGGGNGCKCGKCPPPYLHCYEGPPKLKFKPACPKPVCDPCMLPHYGYFQACWRPWVLPPDWTHCPVPPPGALVPQPPPPPYPPIQEKKNGDSGNGIPRPGTSLPAPRPVDDGQSRRTVPGQPGYFRGQPAVQTRRTSQEPPLDR